MKLPTKEEIRRKYNIRESDFAVLAASHLPSQESLNNEGARIERLGYWDRFEVWLKRSFWGGVILAVIFFGEIVDGVEAIGKYGPRLYGSGQQIVSYIGRFSRHTIVVSTDPATSTSPMPLQEDGPHERRVALATAGTPGIQANSITPFGKLS